ncbi:MAG: hypothetical protein ACREFO_12765 [Acetobacteraceae bacterium]
MSDYQQLPGNLPVPQEACGFRGRHADLALAGALGLPAFEARGERLFWRLTLIVTDGRIEHAFYPVFPPGQHAAGVLEWLRGHAAAGR